MKYLTRSLGPLFRRKGHVHIRLKSYVILTSSTFSHFWYATFPSVFSGSTGLLTSRDTTVPFTVMVENVEVCFGKRPSKRVTRNSEVLLVPRTVYQYIKELFSNELFTNRIYPLRKGRARHRVCRGGDLPKTLRGSEMSWESRETSSVIILWSVLTLTVGGIDSGAFRGTPVPGTEYINLGLPVVLSEQRTRL